MRILRVAFLILCAIYLMGCRDVDRHATQRAFGQSSRAGVIEEVRFELSRQLLPLSRGSFVDKVLFLNKRDWPRDIMDAPADTYLLETFGNITVHAHLLKFAGGTFYFVSKQVREGNKGGIANEHKDKSKNVFHRLSFIEVNGEEHGEILLERVKSTEKIDDLEFEVAPFDGRIILMYAELNTIFAVLGSIENGKLTFDAPTNIWSGEETVDDLRLVRSRNRLHLLWTTERNPDHVRVYYASSEDLSVPWRQNVLVSARAVRGSANLVADHSAVYLAWAEVDEPGIDRSGSRATGRVLLLTSEDEGRNFMGPVFADIAEAGALAVKHLILAPSPEGPVLFWFLENGLSVNTEWIGVVFNRYSSTASIIGRYTSRELYQAYRRRILKKLDALYLDRQVPNLSLQLVTLAKD